MNNMSPDSDLLFGFSAAPATEKAAPKPDHLLYDEVTEDCHLAWNLGFEGAWMLEHHGSNYFPTPSPLLFLARIAGELPEMSLGTCVLVLPWYHPLRLAGELSMLNTLTRGTLRIGLGRGTAKMEYDAFGLDMNKARARFAEGLKVIQLALAGGKFTFEGEHFRIPRPIELRPRPTGKKIELYGAIGSPPSAGIMGDLGIPPLFTTGFPEGLAQKMLETWRTRMAASGGDPAVMLPIVGQLLIADTDEEAYALGRKYLPYFFQVQRDHYEIDLDPWAQIEEYKDFSRIMGNFKRWSSEPETLNEYMQAPGRLIGSPESVARKLERYVQMGFRYITLQTNNPGMPKSLQRESLTRFAREIGPRFSSRFAKAAAPRRADADATS